jgi:hypothetical protein
MKNKNKHNISKSHQSSNKNLNDDKNLNNEIQTIELKRMMTRMTNIIKETYINTLVKSKIIQTTAK